MNPPRKLTDGEKDALINSLMRRRDTLRDMLIVERKANDALLKRIKHLEKALK
jgi:hypothetical protein